MYGQKNVSSVTGRAFRKVLRHKNISIFLVPIKNIREGTFFIGGGGGWARAS